MQELLLKLSFILNVAIQEQDLNDIGTAADALKALAENPNDKEAMNTINGFYGNDWTIEEINREYRFKDTRGGFVLSWTIGGKS